MTVKRCRFTAEFNSRRRWRWRHPRSGDGAGLATRHEIHPNQVSAWKQQAVEGVSSAFASDVKGASLDESWLKKTYVKTSKLTLEQDFFRAGWRTELVGLAGDGGFEGGAERGSAVHPAGAESVVAVLGAEGRERGELGADVAGRRTLRGAFVSRQPVDVAAFVARRAASRVPPSALPDAAHGLGGHLPQAADQRAAPGVSGNRRLRTFCRRAKPSVQHVGEGTWGIGDV